MSADVAAAADPDGDVARAEYTHDDRLVDEADLSDPQLDDNEYWLYIPPQCSMESAIHDLYAWLKAEPEVDARSNKKYIDTRTFTRPKKRSTRMSFEAIFEGLSPSPSKNVWKHQDKDATHIEDTEKLLPVTIEDKESVPPMLKPAARAANILPDETLVISGQESMETFLNMSQSKGIDSFINLGEPEFNDLLMNVSQPSVLYTSVMSLNDSAFVRSDAMPVFNTYKAAQRGSNVAGRKSNSSDGANETFVMRSADNTITPNMTYSVNSANNTFCQESVRPDRELNETYNAEAAVEALRSSLGKEGTALSSTFVTEPNADVNSQLPNATSTDAKPLDTTYLSSARDAEGISSIESDAYKPTTRAGAADLNVTCNISSNGGELFAGNTLDMSFQVPVYNQSTPMNPNALNPTSRLAAAPHPTFKAPTSLRRELLAEIQRSDERKLLDTTYDHIPGDHPGSRDAKENMHCNENETDNVPASNRYHTYRKPTASTGQCRNPQRETQVALTAQKEVPVDQRRFYTFTRKSNHPVDKTDNIAVNEGAATRPSADGTFRRPAPPPKAQQKRMLSKLPQFLQKSNPNLVSSSLRGAGGGMPPGISSVGYIKGSQPNIVQNIADKPQLLHPSKLHPYGKLRSGSEQRLLEVNVDAGGQFPMKSVTAGSTESIESTQSAQSAPDLDDRLSTCSDSSGNISCDRHTMNINQLHRLVRMQEESLKQDAMPKLSRQVLENTWVEEKTNLLSPILKNGMEHGVTDRLSLNTDTSMKCSSPLSSLTGSSHALNNDGNPEGSIAKTKNEEVAVVEKTEGLNQVVPKIENKTRLRQPTNWNAGSKPAAVISGIPRPASRIPALRFTRPSAKPKPI